MAKTQALFDDFNDNSLAAKWSKSTTGGATGSEANQELELHLPSSSVTGDYVEFASSANRDFSSSYVQFQVLQIPNTATSSDAAIEIDLANDGVNVVRWVVEAGTLFAQRTNSGVTTTLSSFTLNLSTDNWWRLREASGVIYWDTSNDGQTWYNKASWTHGLTVTSVGLWVNLYTWRATETNPGNFIIDNFNMFPWTASPVTLDGDSSLSATPKVSHYSAVTFDGEGSLSDLHTLVDIVIPQTKVYEYKIFDSSGNYLHSLNEVVSDFNYTQDINTAGNGIQIELARTSDTLQATIEDLITETTADQITTESDEVIQAESDSGVQLGSGGYVDLNYGIEIWVFYGYEDYLVDENGGEVVDENGNDIGVNVGAPDGLRLFAGYVSGFYARYGDNETILLDCLPYSADLDQHVIKSGETTTVPYNSYDPSAILKGILDGFVADGGLTTYSGGSVLGTGSTVSYTYKLNTVLEGIQKVLELAPSDWWWFGDVGKNLIYFSGAHDTPSHTFTLGLHIKSLELQKTIEGIVNTFYFEGGDTVANDDTTKIFSKYIDTPSRTAYRQGLDRQSDQRVTVQDSADILGGSAVDRGKDPKYIGQLTILDKQYEIETIELGQLVAFNNFNNFIDSLTLQIVGITYSPDAVTVKLDHLLPSVPKRLEDIKRNLTVQEQLDVPATPD